MKINSFSSISDLHIETIGDQAYILLEKFLKLSKKQKVEAVFLLGDIFDVLVGNHSEYLSEFDAFFKQLDDLLMCGIKVFYFEGNHDFHIGRLFRTRFTNYVDESFFYVKKSLIIQFNDKNILFDHGDNIEPGSVDYYFFKEFMRSDIMDFVVNNYLTYQQIKNIGKRASSSSARYSRISDEESVRIKFRKAACHDNYGTQDIVIMGHSHILEEYKIKTNQRLKYYYNNGYPVVTQKCLLAKDGKVSLIPIE
jgi:UDP-2,3-diacylglucosamine hydrolase